MLILDVSKMRSEHLLTLHGSYQSTLEMLSRLIAALMKGSRPLLLKGQVLLKKHGNNVIPTAMCYCFVELILVSAMNQLHFRVSHSITVWELLEEEKPKNSECTGH